MPISVDVLEKSLSQTTGFFKGPDLFKKWAKMAFILFVFALFTGGGLGGGGGSFDTGNLPSLGDTGSESSGVSTVSFLGQEDPLSNLTGFATLPTDLNFESLLPIILVLIIVVLIVVFILRIIGNAALFAALNSIETNIVRIGAIKENLSKGFSLAGLEFILGLLFLPFAIMLGLAIIGLFFNLFLGAIGNSPVIENLMSQIPFINDSGTLLIFGVIGFIGVIIFGIIGYFLDQFGVYLMYKKNIGSFTALREGISLGLGNFVELLVLIIIQIVLGIVIGIIVFVIGLIFVIPVIIIGLLFAGLAILALQNIILLFILGVFGVIFLLLVMYATTFALTPVYVFIFRYNMNVLEGFLNKR